MSTNKDILEKAAYAGGNIIKKYFGQELATTQKKTAADLRTKADTESEEAIIKVLQEHFPDCTILTEEQGEIRGTSSQTFIIDPLDGSNNFVMGIPYFSVAIGLMENDILTEGLVLNPITDHLYYAAQDKGIFFNNTVVNTNKVNDITQTTLSYIANYQTWPDQVSQVLKKLGIYNIKRVLNLWSPALDSCLLASGKIEAIYCAVTAHDEFYDFAIGKFMAKEGRAKITTLQGKPDNEVRNGLFLATNGTEIHDKLLTILKDE